MRVHSVLLQKYIWLKTRILINREIIVRLCSWGVDPHEWVLNHQVKSGMVSVSELAFRCVPMSGEISKFGIPKSHGKSFCKCCFDPGLWVHLSISFSYFSPLHVYCLPLLLSPYFSLSSSFIFSTCQTFLCLLSMKPLKSGGEAEIEVWNMKQSYIRSIQSAAQKLSWVKHLCTRKHTNAHTLQHIPTCNYLPLERIPILCRNTFWKKTDRSNNFSPQHYPVSLNCLLEIGATKQKLCRKLAKS